MHPQHRVRTRLMAVVAWTTGATALAAVLYPELVAALFAFLVGVVSATALRVSQRTALIVGVLAVLPFAFADMALLALAASPAASAPGPIGLVADLVARHPGLLLYLALGAGLLIASPAVAGTALAVISRLPSQVISASPSPLVSLYVPRSPLRCGREEGLRRADWELARSTAYGREMVLGLLGIDPSTPLRLADVIGSHLSTMRELDELLLERLTRFDVVVAYAPRDRLLVLPEESVRAIGQDALNLCELASARLGRKVRMAMVGCPSDGTDLRELLIALEIDLSNCFTTGAVVQVAGMPVEPAAREAGDVAGQPAHEPSVAEQPAAAVELATVEVMTAAEELQPLEASEDVTEQGPEPEQVPSPTWVPLPFSNGHRIAPR